LKRKKIEAEVEWEQWRHGYQRSRSDIITWFLYPRSFRHIVYLDNLFGRSWRDY